jgi:glycosyltransferase involved in cell wall biosynthesis
VTDREHRALFVHSANELYGADRILLSLLERRPPGWVPHVILPCDVPYRGLLAERLSVAGIPHEEMKLAVLRRRYFSAPGSLKYSAFFAYSVAAILRRIRKYRFGIVHSNTIAVIPGAVAARLARLPHVWHCHEIVVSPAIVRRTTARLAVSLSDVVVAVSDAVRQHLLQDRPGASNIRVLRNGIDLDEFDRPDERERVRAEFGFAPGEVVAGTLGRISRLKGQTYLLEAVALLKDLPALKFLIAGDPFVGQEEVYKEVVDRIEKDELRERVVLSPFRSEPASLYASLDIYVLPSILPESFGLVVLEAMAARKPVVATELGGSREMVVDGETGYLVPADDAAVLADRLRRLAASPEVRREMGAAGRRRAERLFTRERMVREFWSLMDEVIRQGRTTAS